MNVLLIDNYDSFTFNLEGYFLKAGCMVATYRNDVGLSIVEETKPDLIVLSPGPSSPQNAGMCMELVDLYKEQYPIFGVCLGMQVIAEVFGTPIRRLDEIVHGGASEITHDGKTIFEALPNPFLAGRYHSLGAYLPQVSSQLAVSAHTQNNIVMGLRHTEYPIEGVQFHPESVLTMQDGAGMRLIENVVRYIHNKI